MTQTLTHARNRNWVFTLNNYTPQDIDKFKSIRNCKFTFQEETGENGTPHLQGLLIFKNARTLQSLKKLHPKAHWEICKSVKASQLYCTKEDTRTGEIFSNMDPPEMKRETYAEKQKRIYQHVREHMKLDEEDLRELALLPILPEEVHMRYDPRLNERETYSPQYDGIDSPDSHSDEEFAEC